MSWYYQKSLDRCLKTGNLIIFIFNFHSVFSKVLLTEKI